MGQKMYFHQFAQTVTMLRRGPKSTTPRPKNPTPLETFFATLPLKTHFSGVRGEAGAKLTPPHQKSC